MSENERGFAESAKKDWVRAAAKELSDHDPLEKLSFQSGDLQLSPYCDSSDLPKFLEHVSFDHGKPWVNAPNVIVGDQVSANEAALRHLQAGADGIVFDLRDNVADPGRLLAGIELGYCSIFFKGNITAAFLLKFAEHAQSQFDTKEVRGAAYGLTEADYVSLGKSFQAFARFNTLGLANTSHCHDANALARTFVDLQARLAAKSFRLEPAALFIALSDDFFGEIIRLRAIDLVWSSFCAAYEQNVDLFVHCYSGPLIDPGLKPHGNMIAAASRAVSAIIGGAHALTLDPESKDVLAERMARNVSFILAEESHLSKVSGAASGSYFVETAAWQLAEKIWKIFKHTVGK